MIKNKIIILLFVVCPGQALCQSAGNDKDAMYSSSYALFLSNKYDTAMALANKLIRLDSNNCKYYKLKGDILTEINKESIDSVEAFYKKSLQKGCDSTTVYIGLENLYFNKMKFDQALVYINKIIALKPDSGYLYFRRASTKMLLDDRKGMKADLEKAIEKGYTDADIMLKTIDGMED